MPTPNQNPEQLARDTIDQQLALHQSTLKKAFSGKLLETSESA